MRADRRFDDHPSPPNVAPIDRNAEARICGAPTTRSDQEVRAALRDQLLVKETNVLDDRSRIGSGSEAYARIDVHDVENVLDHPIAESLTCAHDASFDGDFIDIDKCTRPF